MKRLPFTLLLLTLFSSQSYAALSSSEIFDSLDPWHIYGEDSVHYDYYGTNGDATQTRYPFTEQGYPYAEFREGFDRRFSNFESLKVSASGLLNGSEYRSTDDGWLFEDIRMNWEKGDGAIPFKLELGDFTGNFSYRTIQQTLKGVQLEIQPDIKIGEIEQHHSIIAFSGIQQQDWREIEFNKNLYNGISWVADLAKYGILGTHLVHNFRDKKATNIADQNQAVWSLTYEKAFKAWTEKINTEGEFATFWGDNQPQNNPAVVDKEKSDTGGFFQFTGDSESPLSYGFRYESYGDHFQPRGAVITTNRRTLSWKAGWELQPGLNLDGRIELYRDNLESTNRQDTNLYGLNLTGPIQNSFLRDLTINSGFYRQASDNGDRFVNNRTYAYQADISTKVYEEWLAYMNYSSQNILDDAFGYTMIQRNYETGVGHPINFKGVQGNFRTGALARITSGPSQNIQAGLNFLSSLYKGGHSFSFNTDYLFEDGRTDFAQDVANFNAAANYAYTLGPHRFGIIFEYFNRNPWENTHVQDTHLSLTYTFSFDKPAGVDIRDFSITKGYPSTASPILEQVRFESSIKDPIFLDHIAPGLEFPSAEAYLKQEGLSLGSTQGNLSIYEGRIFENIDQRQRVAIQQEQNLVNRSVVIIDINPSIRENEANEIYTKVRNHLIGRLGSPTFEDSKGSFASSFRDDVNSGSLIRLDEWQTNNGIIRLGIPKRLDNQVRIEIHFASNLPPSSQNNWSIEEII